MMLTRNLLLLCCLISITVGADEENTDADKGSDVKGCGRTYAKSTRNVRNIRIIRAREAEKGAWPWMAEIYLTNERMEKRPMCGGALISRSHVVTAGHCVTTRDKSINVNDVSIRLGDHNLESDNDGMNSIDVNVAAIYLHEEFNPRTYANDIAILRLERPLTLNKNIQAICLPLFRPPLSDHGLDSKNAYVAGWGATSLRDSPSNVLLEMTVVTTDDETCLKAYKGKADVTGKNMCAVGIYGAGPCMGFSGAPLMMPGNDKYYLVGILSFGLQCGHPDYPDVYSRVSNYVGWMMANMVKN